MALHFSHFDRSESFLLFVVASNFVLMGIVLVVQGMCVCYINGKSVDKAAYKMYRHDREKDKVIFKCFLHSLLRSNVAPFLLFSLPRSPSHAHTVYSPIQTLTVVLFILFSCVCLLLL